MTGQLDLPARCAARYAPERLLGRGGQGVVLLANQVALDRRVALKLLVEREPADLARFRLEARLAAQVAHPNVVAVLDHDVEEGRPWIAYEYVEGESLRDRLDRGPLPWREATAIAAALARGLAAVHAAGAVPRDVKPENVLLPAGGEAKLADFGLAWWDRQAVGTAGDVVLGTPAYMAPEVVRGERAAPAADVYAVGVVLFELLHGQPPFAGDDTVEVIRAHLDTLPAARLSALPGPAALTQLITRCLDKHRSERPATAAELAAALDALTAPVPPRRSAPTCAHGARPARRTAKLSVPCAPPRVSRTQVAIAAAALMLALGMAAGAAFAMMPRALAARPPAAVPPPAVPSRSAVELGPFDARIEQTARRVEVDAIALHEWELAIHGRCDAEADVAVPRRCLDELARQRDALVQLQRELAVVAAAAPQDLRVAALRARAAGLQFEVWFRLTWGAQYLAQGRSYSAARADWHERLPMQFGAGAPLWREFSARLGAVLRRGAADPGAFDARSADALFEAARAYRFLRAAGDERFFHERDLPADVSRWCETDLAGPMGSALRDATRLLLRSATGGTKLAPELHALADQAQVAFPGADEGWCRLVDRVGTTVNASAASTLRTGPPAGSRR